MGILKQGVAATFIVGPFMTSVGALATALTIGTALPKIAKQGAGSFTTMVGMQGAAASHITNQKGYYAVFGSSGDIDTVGRLVISITNTSALAYVEEHMVMAPAAYDAMYSTGNTGNMRVDLIDAPNATGLMARLACIQNIGTVVREESTAQGIVLSSIKSETSAIHAESTAMSIVLASVKAETSRIAAETTVMNPRLSSVNADVSALKVSFGTWMTTVWNELASIKAETSLIHGETTRIAAETTGIGAKISSLISESTAHGAILSSVKSETSAIKVNTDKIVSLNTTLWNELASIGAVLASVKSETSRIAAETTVMNPRISSINSETTAIKVQTDKITSYFTTVWNELSSISAVLASVKSETTQIHVETSWNKARLSCILDKADLIDGSITNLGALRIQLAALAGGSTGGQTANIKFYAQDGLTVRIDATVSTKGDRTGITLTT